MPTPLINESSLVFRVQVLSKDESSSPIQVYVRIPSVEDQHPGRWTCRFGWVGLAGEERLTFGATSLQALEAALSILAACLQSAFAGKVLQQDGLPFIFPDAL